MHVILANIIDDHYYWWQNCRQGRSQGLPGWAGQIEGENEQSLRKNMKKMIAI